MIRKAATALMLVWSGAATAAPRCPADLAPALFPVVTSASYQLAMNPAARVSLDARRARIDACRREAPCVVDAAHWTAAERDAVAAATPSNPRLTLAGDDAAGAVRREIDGLNSILHVYAGVKPPLYPVIDGPDDAAGSPERLRKVEKAVGSSRSCTDRVRAADQSVGLAVALLAVNDRASAIQFDPLDDRYNRGARRIARDTDWSQYPYTALVVPGIGPEDTQTRLSAASDANAQLAAERFRQRLAPLIVVTGGAVHPRRTRFVEAIEIKRALVARYDVPADAIIVEPYARHTTTNLRNITRRLAALGVPLDRDTLILTNPTQSAYIEGPVFAERNLRELGYQPGTVGRRLGPNDLVFRPSPLSLRVDPVDPLDP